MLFSLLGNQASTSFVCLSCRDDIISFTLWESHTIDNSSRLWKRFMSSMIKHASVILKSFWFYLSTLPSSINKQRFFEWNSLVFIDANHILLLRALPAAQGAFPLSYEDFRCNSFWLWDLCFVDRSSGLALSYTSFHRTYIQSPYFFKTPSHKLELSVSVCAMEKLLLLRFSSGQRRRGVGRLCT